MTDWPFDVFLCYNRQDMQQVKEIGRQLQELGLRVWLDDWVLQQPEMNWKPVLDKQVEEIGSVAVFVGPDGVGPWQDLDIQAFLLEFAYKECPMIPVTLERVMKRPNLPPYLLGHNWVDFRKYRPDPIEQLHQAISAKPDYVEPVRDVFYDESEPIESAKFIDTFATPKLDVQSFDLGNGVMLQMVAIPAGTFIMGSPEDENNRDSDEGPQHSVTVSRFSIGQYAITQAQWKAVAEWPEVNRSLPENPSKFKGDNRPVETINSLDAQEFCDRLSVKTGCNFRLPSEAEWEYACRAGTSTAYSCGQDLGTKTANFNDRYAETTAVGNFLPNPFGLYDMHGNVWEWCADLWHDSYEGAPSGSVPWLSDGYKGSGVLRGGAWNSKPDACRSGFRLGSKIEGKSDIVGFRVAFTSS
ncbi:MAG: SUMF1/EgtB/PvdO family nonheme iron enzyme [Synechococcus sp.]